METMVNYIDEREDVQKKTFGKWINSQLIKINFSLVTDLFYDLRDGTRLLALLSVLTGRTYKPEKGHMRVHHLNNVSSAFRLLDKHNVKLVNISSNDIVDGNPKLTLGLVWSIILHWQVQDVLKGSMAELQQSSLEKTLLSWCQEATKDYAEIAITNFTTSWSDGLAFIALIHRFRPDLFDYEIVSRKPANARLEYAFRMANKHLEIARLLDPEDVNTSNPDKKSIMMYVMCLYQALPHAKVPLVPSNGSSSADATTGSSGASATSLKSNEPVDFSAYQTLMEEVLVWLLAAEDHLDSATTILGDLQSVKEQFHKHEEFLLELTSQQGSVGAVLHEGARLVKEGELSNEEADEIHIQMRLLNSRWDQLRTKSMDRQARIHETLTKLQQEQLERLRQWLTATEDRISQLAAVPQPETLTAADQMLQDHQALQRDLEAQQEHVNALSNMVVIVDESVSDNCAQMEDQLSALGERWSHVCRWAEQRASALQQLSNHWEQLTADLTRLKCWLASHEHSLRLIETNPSTDRSQMIDVARQLQLLERDMEPHVQRLSQLQENILRLPTLIHAVTVKENSKKSQPVGNFKCVDRLLSDVENFEDRMEALNEIMEAQRQRLAKSGLDLTMVVLPPDITTSLTAFGSNDAINNTVRSDEEATSIKKRKLDTDRHLSFEAAIHAAKQHLEKMEILLEEDSNPDDLTKRHVENKTLLDEALKSGHILLDELQNEASESFAVEDTMSSITERWLLVEELLTQKGANQQDVERLLRAKHCEKELDNTLSTVNKLSNVEERNEETLSKFQAMLQMVTDQINNLTSPGSESCEKLETAVESLKCKICNLESRISEFEKDVVLYRQLKDESQSLDKWMAEVNNFLTAEDVAWGDVEVLEAQLEQSNALQDDVKTLEPSVANIKHVITLLAPKVDEDLLAEMNEINERLATTWITVIAGALQKNGVLTTALSLTRQTVDGIESTNTWLNELELEIPPPAVINSTSELSQTLRKLNALKNRVDLKTNEYKSFIEAGNAVVAHPHVSEELKDNFRLLSQRWNAVSGGVVERQRALKAASHHYGEFKVLTAQECDWQDKLEKKLMRSTTLAADAEEISEELDDLENYMKNRPKARLLRIESMGNELVSLNIMSESVGSEVKSLADRWAVLEEKAKEKAEWLEKRVRGAQQCEQRLVQLHSAINSIDAELCSSLEQDLYGDELPELSQRLSHDIAQQEALLSEIRHEEEDYQAEGRKEAANRLHEQLSFIEATLQDVRNKFRKFQNPSELEPRLERMLRVLRDLEQSMCYIELASDDCEAIEGQLNNCIRFYASLSDIKTEVEAVLREGRQQVEEELVEDKLTVSAELDAMKALYNRLGEQVAIARETLEKALQLSYQLNLDINAMTDWLNHLVSEIHKTEDTFADDPNTADEIPFYEKCLYEMLSNQSKMDSIRDNYGLFCGLCDPTLLETLRERVEDITQEWQRIEERLKNKISNLKGEHNDDHDDVEDDGEPPHLPQQNRNGGDVPVRMYRSVVLTSVRQFTDPGSPTMQKASLELPASPTLAEDMDPKDLTIDVEMEESDSAKDEEMDGPGHSTFVDTLGYFNAAFEDFEEQEKEAYMQDCVSSSRSGLEVIRGNVADFNEEDEEMIESSPSLTSDSSSESSDSNSVKDLPVDIETTVPEKLKILQVDDSYVVEVKAGNLPSPEVPSMEVLNSRPITPDDFLTPEEEAWTYPQITVDADQQIVSTVTNHEEVTVQNQVSFEQLVIERFNSQRLTVASQDRCHSPVTTSTPPPTPALCETNAFDETFANDSPKVDGLERLEVRVGEHDKHVLPSLEALQVIEVDDKAPDDGQPPLDGAEGRVTREVEEQVATDYDQEIQILKAPCTEVVFHSLSGKSSPSVDVVKPGVIENVPIIEVPVVEDVLVIDAAVADETLVAGKAPIIENVLVVEEHQGSCPIEKEAEKGMSEHPDDGKQQIIEDFVEIDVAEVENVQTRVVEDTVEHMVVDVSKEVSSDDKQFQVLPDSNEMEHVKDEDVMIVEENQLCISTQEVIADDDLSQSSASSSDMNDFEGENVPVFKDCQSPQYSPSAEKKIIETSVPVTEDDKTPFVEELADSPALSRSTSSSCSSSDAGEEQIPVVKDEQPHVLPSIEVTVHQLEDATADAKQLQQFEETIEIDEVREQEVKVLTDEQPRIARSHTGSSEISSLSRESDDIQQETSNVENSRISKEAVDICREAIESDSAVGTAVLIDDEKEAIVLNRPLDQNLPHEADLVSVKAGSVQLTANEARAEDANDPTQRALSVTNIRPSRKVSRDEGTQTDFCGYTGRLHVSTPVQPAESTSIIQTQTIPLQVEEMATSAADAQEDPSTTLQEIDADLNRLVASMESAEQVCPDGDVFSAVANVSESKAIEDVDSFYGSDKEVDSEVVFSHTDSSSSSSSSSESDVEPETIQKLEIEASSPKDVQESQLDREIAEFNAEVKLMSQRIDEVSAKFSPSSPIDLESAEMELSLLDPDVATLISRGDSLVLQVQKVDLERALRINTTTGELRAARTSLKASSEVRRQRQVEQELTLKDCQKKTEQLQLWLANIAQTLDHVTRINDQSQIESLEEELNRRQSDIRQLTEAAGKLKEQQVLEYQALISSLTIRWQDLQRQFVDFQTKETSALAADLSDDMGGPDFVTRVNKLREAIASVSRQMHSPPLNLKHYEQLSGQEDAIKIVKSALYTLKGDVDTYNREKNDAVEAADALQQKEQIQRVLDKLREEWTLLNRTFAEKQVRVHQSQTTWRNLHADMKDFDDWLTGAEASLVNLQSESHNRSERKEKLKELESQVTARHKVMSNITSTCREVAGECSTADAVLLREKQDTLGKRWRSLLSGLAAVRQRLTSLDGSPLPVAKLTPLVMSPARKDETNGSESDLTVHAAKETPPTTPSTIVASLDKSILQIRDWLTVLETMLKQQVAIVGDSDDVLQLLEKQKNVLRELEQKKPQLDELVQTAESIKDGGPPTGGKQLPAQVSKLREHWEETATAVTSRRNQLEELLTDSHQFERRKQDVDQWLGRMENRLSKLAPVAGTADLIDTQHREQKVLHNEIQQYKSQVEQLTQLSEKLVANYPHDDTSRAVRTNENLTQRYSVLHTGVNARGRALNAAMSSLHSFDRSLDKFMAWLSDTESALESLELELDSYGPGVKTSRERVLIQLKELSVELDGRRDEQAGLAGAGQRLINTLSDDDYRNNGQRQQQQQQQQQANNDDALMLRQRLDDMNRRWHGLRAKTVAIRNRLENNTEHWNALLLSLRELIEWVIRKDTELTGLGPIRGDLSTLVKQQDDFRAFRRQLDDKRPLIEQSILTGRQLVANEAPLSDASDSEAANRDVLPGDSRGYRSAEEAARELTQGIRREGTKLAERWAALRERTERWNVDLDTTTNRVQQLQASMDDASNRLVPAETIRSKWINPIELSPQQVQQQMDQLKELSDKIAPVQLTIEEVNDQAARLADSGVPLSHANLSRLDDLNSRWKVLQSSMDDRYQQLCGVTREGALTGPLLHSFLASSVDRPWERSVTEADVPYYVNHQTETTHWDHPQLEELMNSLSEFNDVRFSAYRMALKLRRVQKFLCLDKLELNTAIDTFDAHGLRAQNDKVIDIPDMVTVLRSLYEVVVATYPGEIRLPLVIDLCLNWILNVYDSQRSGEVRVLSFKVVITLMCRGHLEDKYRYLFRLIADPNRLVDAPKLGVLLHDCVQMPRELGEVAAFGGSNIEPSVKCCFEKAGKQRQSIEAVHFLAWMKREPQSVVWLPVLHRLAASESARHQSKCNVCKATPIIGLRYRCLKCLSFDMCQNCFFTGRVSKHHKLTHPMQEYCTTTTSGEDLKDFTRTLRNKFKSKRYFKKHPRLGYLPVQTALEGTTTPSDAQSEVSSQMPSSAAQDVLVHSAANSVVDGIHKDFTPESEDEHQLIAQYCRSLNGDALGMSMGVVPRSPVQLIAALDSNHKEEIETMIRELEEENATLQAEYERLRSQQSPSMSFSFSSSPDDATPIPHQAGASSSGNHTSEVERDMLAEARLLRQHKTRLEARMKILEEHNRQLETQLSRLRQLLDEPGGNSRDNSSPAKTGTLQTRAVTAAHLATDTPVRTNGHDKNHTWAEHSVTDRLETRPPPPPHGNSNNSNTYNAQNVGNLLFMAGDLGKAVGSLVNVMTDDHSPGLTDEED